MQPDMWQEAKDTLMSGSVCVLPTDTLYGVTALAANNDAVEEVYKIKNRDHDKPCILLCGNIEQVKELTTTQAQGVFGFLDTLWPARVSVILPAEIDDLRHLHRGKKTLGFRIPNRTELKEMLVETGPIIAPSANTQGSPPAENTAQAKEYFGDSVDYYLDIGDLSGKSSTVIDVSTGTLQINRAGAVDIDTIQSIWSEHHF